jgi:hypothetical protein
MAMKNARDIFAQTDQRISELKERIARQREVIKQAKLSGHSTAAAETIQHTLHQTLRAFEKRRKSSRGSRRSASQKSTRGDDASCEATEAAATATAKAAATTAAAMTSSLILKRASASRQSGQWRDDDYDVLENGVSGPHLLPRCIRATRPPLDVGERPQRRHQTRRIRLRADTRGGDGGVREELAA